MCSVFAPSFLFDDIEVTVDEDIFLHECYGPSNYVLSA
jgi:hypothetical protein